MEQEKTEQSTDAAEIWAEDEYHFEGQRPNERVMFVRNQHPVVLFRPTLFFIVSLLIPYLLIRFTGGGFRLYALGLYTAPALFWIASIYYAYFNGFYILTNQRLLNINQRGFFNTQVSEAELNRIQDVSSEIAGFLQTLFKYGDVTIRTASNASLLILKNIGDPYNVQQAIVRALKDA